MAPLGYLEVLDAKGNVTGRTRVDAFPITVGRAYSNQVVVDDPYVCPVHLAIEADDQGRLIARDLNSVNGLYAGASDSKRIARLELGSGTQFRIGRTSMRYRTIDHPSAPTLIDRENGTSFPGLPYIALSTGLLVFLMLCLESYLGSVERVTVAGVISQPLTTFATMLVWTGLWSLAGRIIVSGFHFSEHATIASAAIIWFLALSTVSEWIEFLFPVIPALWILGLFGTGAIVAALIYGHLRFASQMRRQSRLWVGLSISLAMIGISLISEYASRSKFSNVMEFTGVVKPIATAWLPTISLDRFIDNSQSLKEELDTLAQRAKPVQP
jgi:FHA domain-containing protein